MPNSLPSPESSAAEREQREVEELISKVREAKDEARNKLLTLGACAEELRQRVRRNPTDMSGPIGMFAMVHMRFANAAVQGIQRTSGVNRLVERAKAEHEDLVRVEEDRLKRDIARKAREKAQKQVESLTFPAVGEEDALDELYGEVNTDA